MQETTQIKVISASEIARIHHPLKEINERRLILGKAFEQAYCYVSWKVDGIIDLSNIDSEIKKQQSIRLGYKYDANNNKIEERLMNDEITYCDICNECWNVDTIFMSPFNKEYDWMCIECMLRRMKDMLIEKAEETTTLSEEEKEYFLRIFNLFLSGNICGKTPPTTARRYENYIVTAKPDLWDVSWNESTYNEFKIGELDDYAREQAKIFAWVVNEPINLYGVSSDFWLQKEIVYPSEDIGKIPESIGKAYDIREICENCNLPNCNCKPVYHNYNYDNDVDYWE